MASNIPAMTAPRSDAAPAVKVEIPAAANPPPGSKTITIIDGSSGKHQDVVLPGKE